MVRRQLDTIRQVMLEASRAGGWLTLSEIAERTEFGEASVSAQLRHLRKARHGRYRVEKRCRRVTCSPQPGVADARTTAVWEYRVLPPFGGDTQI